MLGTSLGQQGWWGSIDSMPLAMSEERIMGQAVPMVLHKGSEMQQWGSLLQ